MEIFEQTAANKTNPQIWLVEINGRVHEANLDEVKQWIAEGIVLPDHKVKYGNMRWLEAGKLPHFKSVFNQSQIKQFQQQTNYQKEQKRVQDRNYKKSVNARISGSKRLSFEDFKYSLDYPVNYLSAFIIGGAVNIFLAFYSFIGFGVLYLYSIRAAIMVLVSGQLLSMAVNLNFTDKTIRNFVEGNFEETYMINFLDFFYLDKYVIKPFVAGTLTLSISILPIFLTGWIYHTTLHGSIENQTLYNHANVGYLQLMLMNKTLTIIFCGILLASFILSCGLFAVGLIVSSVSEKITDILNPVNWIDVLFELNLDFLKIGSLVFSFYVFVLLTSGLLLYLTNSPVMALAYQIFAQYIAFFAYIFTAVLGGIALYKARLSSQYYGK
jgi:hypothetical protein